MSSKTAIVASLIASIFFISPVLAVDSTTSGAAVPGRTKLLQQKLETKKENSENKIMAVKEKIASKEAALKASLQQFKNKKKAEAADRINTNLNTINQNQTSQMQKHLTNMSRILDKLETKVDPPVAAIAAARTNIASVSAAVAAQAQKDYTITVTSEIRIKTDAKKQRDALHADLQAVKKMVINAKQSVANAIRERKSSGQ